MTEHTPNAGWQGMHGLLLCGLIIAASAIPPLRTWPWLRVAPLAAYAVLVAVTPSLRASFQRPRFGLMTPFGIGAALVIAVVSCAVLIGFQIAMHPDAEQCSQAIPVRALGGILSAGVCFSVLNALLEELVFRGVLFDALESEWGSWAAVCGTALLFGYGHLHGYPPGTLGAILAGTFGVALGLLRKFSRGIGLPFAAHVAADATIFCILAR